MNASTSHRGIICGLIFVIGSHSPTPPEAPASLHLFKQLTPACVGWPSSGSTSFRRRNLVVNWLKGSALLLDALESSLCTL